MTRGSLTCHTAISQWLTQKEPVRYTNKLIKKTTDANYWKYLQLTKKNLIPANITYYEWQERSRTEMCRFYHQTLPLHFLPVQPICLQRYEILANPSEIHKSVCTFLLIRNLSNTWLSLEDSMWSATYSKSCTACSRKTSTLYFLNNSVETEPIWMIGELSAAQVLFIFSLHTTVIAYLIAVIVAWQPR